MDAYSNHNKQGHIVNQTRQTDRQTFLLLFKVAFKCPNFTDNSFKGNHDNIGKHCRRKKCPKINFGQGPTYLRTN